MHVHPAFYQSHVDARTNVCTWFCEFPCEYVAWCRGTSGYHCSGGLLTSYNFIRRPITPNPFRSTNPPSRFLLLRLFSFLYSCITRESRRVCAGITARDFLPFSRGSSPGNKRGESNDKAFTRACGATHGDRWREKARTAMDEGRRRERVGSGQAYYKRDSPYLCELAGPVLSHVLLVLLPTVSSTKVLRRNRVESVANNRGAKSRVQESLGKISYELINAFASWDI